jgi:hypothetical protein
MESSRRLEFFAALTICVLALPGCAARSVNSYIERGTDPSVYKRYGWGPAEQASTGDPRLDNNQIFRDRVQAAVEKQLATKGLEKATSELPDLLVHYHVSIEQQIDLRQTDQSTPCPDCRPFVYDAGTLVIDLVEARTNRLIWRGWSEENVGGVIDNQRWMEERIDQTVTQILKRFPSRVR